MPGPVASPAGGFAEYLRLPFGYARPTFEEGVRRLARAWSAYEPSQPAQRQRLEVIV